MRNIPVGVFRCLCWPRKWGDVAHARNANNSRRGPTRETLLKRWTSRFAVDQPLSERAAAHSVKAADDAALDFGRYAIGPDRPALLAMDPILILDQSSHAGCSPAGPFGHRSVAGSRPDVLRLAG